MSNGTCKLCGADLTLYFYPRPGPAPGNMLVCPKPECEAFVDGAWRRQKRAFESFRGGS